MSQPNSDTTVKSLQSILGGVSLFFVGQVSGQILGFLFTVLLTRTLGVQLYGVFAFVQTIISACSPLSNLGADNALLRYLPKHDGDVEQANEIISIALATVLIGSGIAGIALFYAAPWINQYTLNSSYLIPFLRIFSILLPINAALIIIANTFRAIDKLKYTILINNFARPFLKLVTVGVAIFIGTSQFGIIGAIVVAGVMALLIGTWLFFTKTDLRPRTSISRAKSKDYLNFSLPLSVKGVGNFLYNRIDLVMVGLFLPASAVGVYSVSFAVSKLISLPLVAINQLFPPIASRLHSQGETHQLNSIFSTATRWSLTAALPLALGGIVYRETLLSIFGEGFVTGTIVLTLFVTAEFLNASVGPSGYMLMMTDHQYLLLINQWAFGIANIVLNYFFIIEFGVIGAAVASAVVLISLNLVRVIELWYLEDYFPFTVQYWKPIVAGVISGGVMIVSSTTLKGFILLFAGGGVSVIIYLGVLLAFGLEENDRKLLGTFRS